jgi:tripartite ATP-independent transporter DctM subunit
MSPGESTALLFGTLTLAVFAGAPLALGIGFSALTTSYLLWGPASINLVATSTMGTMLSTLLLAIPLFILMAKFLQKSGIADDLYDLMYHLLGRIRGGLGVGSVMICTVFAAMSGVSAAATVSMGVIALPSMLSRGYDKSISLGSVMAGGALGVLMPPSCPIIVYAFISRLSVGKLFAGAIFPALVLSALFITYIIVITQVKPSLGPAIPAEERVPFKSVLYKFLALILPMMIIISIFGSIFSGLATPTEASAIGALGAIICVGIRGKLNLGLIWECCTETLKITAMILWIITTATWLTNVYAAISGPRFIAEIVANLGANRWVILSGILFVLIVLGCFMDVSGIIMLCVPVFNPVIKTLGFDPLWFALLFLVSLETAYLTPPFGINLFYMKAIVPPDIDMADIYRSVPPFILLQVLGLIFVMIFPQIITYLPNLIFKV